MPTTVRAAVCRTFGQPLEIETVTLADPGPGEVRIRLHAVAICHSDVSYTDGEWGGDLPAVWGHEAAGEIVEVGEGVGFEPGERVVVTLIRSCGECPRCQRGAEVACTSAFGLDDRSPLTDADGAPLGHGMRTGAFAEEVVVHASQIVPIGPDVPAASASLLACGVITGVGAVLNTAKVVAGSTVVVLGCGGVGLNVVQGAALAKAAEIVAVDLQPAKLDLAIHLGAHHAADPTTDDVVSVVSELTDGQMADYVFVATGAPAALASADRLVGTMGAIVVVGMPATGVAGQFDPGALAANNQRILGSKMGTSVIARDIPTLVARYQDGALELDGLVSRTFSLDEINEAMDGVRTGAALRNVIVFDTNGSGTWSMRVDTVETFVVGNPPPSFGGQYFVFVKLVTDDGIVGYGEAYGATFRPHVVAAAIEDLADHLLVGQDPHHIERFWRRAYSRGFTQRPDVTVQGCMSALEMACWDIVGKAAERPVYELLGGRVHETLRSYTYLYPRPDDSADVYADADAAAARAVDEVERGFDAVKFDPAGPYTAMGGHQPRLVDIERTVAFVRTIREAVGHRADLLVGTHGQFTAGGARRLAREIAPYDPLWFEEPVPPDDVGAMAQVAAQSTVPIATGERLTTKYEFARVLEARAASIIQLNLGRAGGLLEGKKIAALAEAFGAQIAPHCYNGPIGLAANVQLGTCSPNFLIIESIMDNSGFHAELLRTPIEWVDGRIVPSTAPGLGVELNEDIARAHPYTGDRTHLTMWGDPIDTADDVVR